MLNTLYFNEFNSSLFLSLVILATSVEQMCQQRNKNELFQNSKQNKFIFWQRHGLCLQLHSFESELTFAIQCPCSSIFDNCAINIHQSLPIKLPEKLMELTRLTESSDGRISFYKIEWTKTNCSMNRQCPWMIQFGHHNNRIEWLALNWVENKCSFWKRNRWPLFLFKTNFAIFVKISEKTETDWQ